MRWHIPLPKLPAVPTAPLSAPQLALLLATLSDLRPNLKLPEVQKAVREVYLRVWIHAALQLGHSPRKIETRTQRFLDVAALFCATVLPSALHSRFDLQMYWAPEVCREAGERWVAAKRAQVSVALEATEAPLLDLAEGTHG